MRRIPLSHRSHVIGFQTLPTGLAEHESALERDFVMLTSFLDAGVTIISQPMTISFENDGRPRRYTPDFEVRWINGEVEIVEVKYRTDLRAGWPRLKPAFAAASALARSRGARFRIATERSIRGPMLGAAKRLLPLRGTAIDPTLAQRARNAVGRSGLPFAELVERMSGSRPAALGTVWRMLASGELGTDFSTPIVEGSWISAP